MKTKSRYWSRAIAFSFSCTPILSGISGWLAYLNVTGFEGANGYAFLYVAMLSFPAWFVVIVFISSKYKISYILSVPLSLAWLRYTRAT